MRVTCLGIDARFTPNARFIAAKQPAGKMIDSVTFINRSVNATGFEWLVTHQPYDNMMPAQLDFYSNVQELTHTFKEPGDYYITLIAQNGPDCRDTCGPFYLPVVDPTIDGDIKINRVDCYKEDSLRVAFRMTNGGYDTIRVGMPITFYDENPRDATPTPTPLGTYYLDKVVYGKDSPENFVVIVPTSIPKLDQIWAVFNDLGATSFPIQWPKSDENVMSVESEFPSSGHNELNYDNNYSHKSDYQFRIDLGLQRDINCTDDEAQLEASYINTRELMGIEWIPNTGLSCTNCLAPTLQLPDNDHTQTVILTSEYYCKDTVSLFIPRIREDVPAPTVSTVPNVCPGDNSINLSNYVEGTQLTWYTDQDDTNGNSRAPNVNTDTPGTYSLWVSQTINNCEGPRTSVPYTVQSPPNPPIVEAPQNICEGEPIPNLAASVTGTNLLWYNQETGGLGSNLTPQFSSEIPGTYQFWISQQNALCESQRASISLTVIGATTPPGTPPPIELCWGETPPQLSDLLAGNDFRWYNQNEGGQGTPIAPTINTNQNGTGSFWVSQVSSNCESPRVEVVYHVAEEVPPPTTNGPVEVCEGEAPINLGQAVNGEALKWYDQLNATESSSLPPTPGTATPGTVSYWITQSNQNCESTPIALTYTVNPIPASPLLMEEPSLCVGDIAPDLNQLVLGEQLSWYNSPIGGVSLNLAPIVRTDSAFTYQYWVSQTLANCEGPKTPIQLVVSEITIQPGGPYEVPEGSNQEIEATIQVYPEFTPFNISWLDANGNLIDTDQLTTVVFPQEPTYYTIIAETDGCLAEETLWVDLIYQLDPTKLFSPNGDGQNDTWYIGDIDKYPEANLTIYNRWGSMVYESQGYNNDWRGTSKSGQDLPMATYYYVIELSGDNNNTVTGSVTIIR